MVNDPRVTLQDWRNVRAANGRAYCVPGVKQFLAAKGLDFEDVVKNGIPISVMESWNDAMAEEVLVEARKRLQGSL